MRLLHALSLGGCHIPGCFEVYNKIHMFGNAPEGKFIYAIRMSGILSGTPGLCLPMRPVRRMSGEMSPAD
jgi:hypothetical protein